MKAMKTGSGLFLFLGIIVISLNANQSQSKVVNFRKLQEFLPKTELAGFTRQKPAGETTSAFGVSSSEAHVLYEKGSGDNLVSIEVKISDLSGVPFGQMGASMLGAMEFENETETGYEKSVQIQGFRGTEKVDRSEENKSAEIQLYVGNRFLVELRGSGTSEVALLHKLLNDIKLSELAKLSQ